MFAPKYIPQAGKKKGKAELFTFHFYLLYQLSCAMYPKNH